MNSLGLLCVEDDDWRAWIAMARHGKHGTRNGPKTAGGLKELFCSDCTPQYEQAMKAEGRCTKAEVKP